MDTKPQEGNESSEQLRYLAGRIISAVKRLPDQMDIGSSNIKTEKKLLAKGQQKICGKYERDYVTQDAYCYEIAVRGQRGSNGVYELVDNLVKIGYIEQHIVIGEDERIVQSSPKMLLVKSRIHSGEEIIIIDVIGDEITLAPKMTEDDVRTVAEFLEKAVAQHEENERTKVREIDEAQTATASAVRENLALLR